MESYFEDSTILTWSQVPDEVAFTITDYTSRVMEPCLHSMKFSFKNTFPVNEEFLSMKIFWLMPLKMLQLPHYLT